MPGQRGGVGVVEDQRGGEPQPGGGLEAVAQLHRGQRVEADLLERPAGLHHLGPGEAEHRGHVAPHQVQQHRRPVGLGKGRQPFGEGLGLLRLRHHDATGRGPHQAAQQRVPEAGRRARAQRGEIEPHGHEGGLVRAHGQVEQVEALVQVERAHA